MSHDIDDITDHLKKNNKFFQSKVYFNKKFDKKYSCYKTTFLVDQYKKRREKLKISRGRYYSPMTRLKKKIKKYR